MKKIGKYEICGLLGKGGMGVVLKVRIPVIDKIVALKLLRPHPDLVSLMGMEAIRSRFVNEAVIMARLRHPGIAAIWDFEDTGACCFFVMEYFCTNLGVLMGETYRSENPSRMLSVDKAVSYGRQILDGLQCMHQGGITHRDIKPFNIMITDEDTVKISDFGMSRLRGEVLHAPANLVMGSPFYAAPEQEERPGEVDARADLYAVGVILHRMLTGLLPDEADRPPSRYRVELDEDWDDFLRKSTARDRKERFCSAREMLHHLDAVHAAWERRKESVCRSVKPFFPLSRKGSSKMALPRAYGIKVLPKFARSHFEVDELWRPVCPPATDFEVHSSGVVADHATGLIWQQSGSDYPMPWQEAHEYVSLLNRERFAGRVRWRLPTVNELMTTLTHAPNGADFCTPPVFDRTKRTLWSCDRKSFTAAWCVSSDLGFVSWHDFTSYLYVRAVCSSEPNEDCELGGAQSSYQLLALKDAAEHG